MKKRDFIKTSMLASLGMLSYHPAEAIRINNRNKSATKHWVWENPNQKEEDSVLEEKYSRFYEAGIRGMFFENDSERHFRIAKKTGLEAHRWMWIMNRGEKELLDNHPEWYAINRKGESCANHPPYVNYYRWLCPSKPEVLEYLKAHVQSTAEKDYVDGVHLDYIRYCDVILPVNLWKNYNIVQTKELPEYDFCYCDTCRQKFKEEYKTDILEIEYPEASLSWRNYRYERITHVVNELSKIVHTNKKIITAAVFPTPEVARRNVRQDWTNWDLDGVCPMIYHGFYKEQVNWIGDAVKEGIHFLCGRFPLYAGLFLPNFKSPLELEEGIKLAMDNGASGVSLFGKIDDSVLEVLKKTAG
jgi:hypothetical protein